jgi:hypothetical protein
MTGTIISGLIRSEEPISERVTLIRHYDPESSPPRVVMVEVSIND